MRSRLSPLVHVGRQRDEGGTAAPGARRTDRRCGSVDRRRPRRWLAGAFRSMCIASMTARLGIAGCLPASVRASWRTRSGPAPSRSKMSSVKRLRRRAVFNRAALCCSDSSTGYARLRVEHGVVDLLAIGSCLPWSPHRGVPPLLSGCLHTVPIVDRFAGQPCDGGHCEAGSVCQFALMQNERPPRAWLAGVRGMWAAFFSF